MKTKFLSILFVMFLVFNFVNITALANEIILKNCDNLNDQVYDINTVSNNLFEVESSLTEENLVETNVDSSNDIASGIGTGTFKWRIDSEGCLYISGKGDCTYVKFYTNSDSYNPEWYKYRNQIKKAIVTSAEMTTMEAWFASCEYLTEVKFSGCDTSNVTSMESLFSDCYSLEKIDIIGGLYTYNVTNMSCMFYWCTSLKSIDLTKLTSTSNVTDMSCMFYECESLKFIDVRRFNTSNVTDMSNMFAYCKMLEHINLLTFDTSNVTNIDDMFDRCYSLKQLDLSKFDLSKVTDSFYSISILMIEDCVCLKTIKSPRKMGLQIQLPTFNDVEWRTDSDSELSFIVEENETYYRVDIDDPYNEYLVQLDNNGIGVEIPDITKNISLGSLIKEPVVPAVWGYKFKGWFKDKGCTDKWDFEKDRLLSNWTVIYAKWEEIKEIKYEFNLATKQKITIDEFTKTVNDGKNYKITYETKFDSKYADMNAKGVISAKKVGTSNIYLAKGDNYYSIEVNVYDPKFVYDNPKQKYYILDIGDVFVPNYDDCGLETVFTLDKNSINKNIASVDYNTGEIIANKKGNVTVTATVGEGKYIHKVSATIKIIDPIFDDIKIAKENINEIPIGKTIAMRVRNGLGQIYWDVSDNSVATIDSKGRLKTIGFGTVDITAIYYTSVARVEIVKEITVPDPEIICNSNTVKVKGSMLLKVKNGVLKPSTLWSIENGEEFATIDKSGRLKGLAPGSVLVKAINNGTEIYKEITIIPAK